MVKYGKSRFRISGIGFKFLSNADLVLQLHLLEVFLAIWIAILEH
jgi:hypothetical protein